MERKDYLGLFWRQVHKLSRFNELDRYLDGDQWRRDLAADVRLLGRLLLQPQLFTPSYGNPVHDDGDGHRRIGRRSPRAEP